MDHRYTQGSCVFLSWGDTIRKAISKLVMAEQYHLSLGRLIYFNP